MFNPQRAGLHDLPFFFGSNALKEIIETIALETFLELLLDLAKLAAPAIPFSRLTMPMALSA